MSEMTHPDLDDPFFPPPAPARPARKNNFAAAPSPPPPGTEDGDPDAPAATYEFRWDVEVEGMERRYGQKFMKQWKRVLQAQKMGPLVTAKLPARHARFQLCPADDTPQQTIAACSEEIAAELAHLRWTDGHPEAHIEGEPPGKHPAGWQGVRVWVTFARQDVEQALSKKPRI